MPAVDCAPTPNATCSRGCLVWAGTARTLADAPQVFRRARDTGAILGRDSLELHDEVWVLRSRTLD